MKNVDFSLTKRILITGGAGFIGGALIRRLLSEKNFLNIIVTTITKIKNIKTKVNTAATYSSSVKSKYKSTAKITATIHTATALNLLIKITIKGSSSIEYSSIR